MGCSGLPKLAELAAQCDREEKADPVGGCQTAQTCQRSGFNTWELLRPKSSVHRGVQWHTYLNLRTLRLAALASKALGYQDTCKHSKHLPSPFSRWNTSSVPT